MVSEMVEPQFVTPMFDVNYYVTLYSISGNYFIGTDAFTRFLDHADLAHVQYKFCLTTSFSQICSKNTYKQKLSLVYLQFFLRKEFINLKFEY
jgi:hypothetical protein